jgi:hypothetical protein
MIASYTARQASHREATHGAAVPNSRLRYSWRSWHRPRSSPVTGAGAPGRTPMTPVSEPGETDAALDQRLTDRSSTVESPPTTAGSHRGAPTSSAAADTVSTEHSTQPAAASHPTNQRIPPFSNVWPDASDEPSRYDQSRQNLDVPVGSVHADPLPIGDQPGGIYDTDDGRQAVLPCDHRTMGHQSSDLRH